MKKTISILVIVAMMLASLLAIIPVAAADPEGTAITNADEFAAMTADGKYYLANDITLKASYGEFKGTLDGNGKTITLVGAIPAFNTLKGATVKNLNVVADFTAETINVGGSKNYGALAIKASGTFSHINVDANINLTSNIICDIGGMFAYLSATATVADCVVTGSLYIPASDPITSSGDACNGAGGFAGKFVDTPNVTMTNCVNYMDIERYVCRGCNGGIVGNIDHGGTSTITNCVNYGTITTVTGGVSGNQHCGNGGIVGQFSSNNSSSPKLDIKNCRNYADITAKTITTGADVMLGGIIGRVYGAKYVTVEGCINSGNVLDEHVGNWSSAGGIIGNVETYNFNWSPSTEADIVAKSCINLGNVSGGTNASGIFGSFMQANAPGIRATIMDSANYGNVSGATNSGGAFAHASSGTVMLTITNFYNAGDVKGGTAGGIVGNLASGWDTDAKNVKNLDILKDAEGNLLPFPTCTFTNCISEGAVEGGGTLIGNSKNAIVLNKCASTVTGLVSGTVDELTENETPTDIEAAKTALLAAIPANPTELTELVEEANDLYADDYTEGWDAYESIMNTARTLVNQAIDVETNAELVASIKEAKEALVALTDVNRDALDAAIEDAAEITNPDDAKYTPKTWAAFVAALDAAQKVAADAKQSAINKAAEALTAAMAGLELIPDLDALTAKIATAKAVDQTLYVSKTLTALNDAITKADALLVDENATGSQVNAIIADIDAAIAALAAKVDPKPLSDKITATETQYKPEVYTAMTYGKVKGAVEDAKDAVEDNDMSQADLDAFVKAIDDAIKGLKNKATWTETDAFLDTVKDLRDTDYTKESWKDYTEALNKVQGYMKEDKKLNVSVEDEAKYLAELKAAYEALVAYATYGAIDTRIDELDSLDETKYTAESWKALQDAIKAVNALKSDRYATQLQADEALAAINAAVEALVEAGANSGDATTPTTNNGGDATEPEKKGCGGVIATTAVVMTSVLALGAAFVAKKKED